MHADPSGCCCAAGITVNGIAGWRVVFASVAAVSAVIGALNFLFARDPNYTSAAGEKSERSALPGGGLGGIGQQIWAVLRIPTFLIIVLQVLPLAACPSRLCSALPAQHGVSTCHTLRC